MMKNKYYFLYWLPNQSKVFSEPYYYGTDDREDFMKKLNTARKSGYEIEYISE